MRVYPRVFRGKLVCALAVAGVFAGCGGGGDGPAPPERVRGKGYSFVPPAAWTIERSPTGVAARDGDAVVSVTVFPLRVAFRPELWDEVVPELDRVADDFARQERGRVTAARTVRVLGRRVRQYEVDVAGAPQQVTFLLVGKREYQLLCVNAAAECGAFVRSFRLS